MAGFTSKVSTGPFQGPGHSTGFAPGLGGSTLTGASGFSSQEGSGGFARSNNPVGARATITTGGNGDGFTRFTSSSEMFGGAVKDSLRRFLERRDQRIIDLSLAPGNENVSQLCWGGQNQNNPRAALSSSGSSGRNSEDEPKDKPPDDKLFEWNEKERFVVKTKITNPEDKEQYIWVDVVKVMVVTAPQQEPFRGKTHLFKFNGKRTQIGTDEGGDGKGGADDEDDEESGSPTPGPSGKSPGTGTTGPSGLGGTPPSGSSGSP